MPKNNLEVRERWMSIPVYIGTALLVYHQKIGWQEEEANWAQVALRPEIWFSLALFLALVLMPKRILWPRIDFSAAWAVLLASPLLATMTTLFSSGYAHLQYGAAIDIFGAQTMARMLVGMGLGILVFNLALKSDRFVSRLVALFIWMPLASIVFGALVLIMPADVLVTHAVGFLTEGGLWYGDRFLGLTTNPYIVATTSGIALALLLPRMLQGSSDRPVMRLLRVLYALGLCGAMALTGVRAMLVVLPVLLGVALWLQFHPTMRGIVSTGVIAVKLSILVLLGGVVLVQSGMAQVLVERLDTDDARLFLWRFYTRMLLENPLGLGLGFEAIVDSEGIVIGARLPPHNTLLQMAMYGGVAGLAVHLFVLGKLAQIIAGMKRRAIRLQRMPFRTQGLILAWCVVLVLQMFGGLIFADHHFVILTSLLLAASARSTQSGSANVPIHPFFEPRAMAVSWKA